MMLYSSFRLSPKSRIHFIYSNTIWEVNVPFVRLLKCWLQYEKNHMSYTKQTLELLFKSNSKIFEETLDKNDLTKILANLNAIIEISEAFNQLDNDIEPIWNEILSDIISIIYASTSGHYRLAISGLRNVLELGCNAFFYLDHKIEYKLYSDSNFKADKYVSSIINDYHFFKTEYIKTFNPSIETIEKKQDSCSSYLSLTYAKLCDVVHGRYQTLTKQTDLKIEFDLSLFKKFEAMYNFTLSAIAMMYVLRFNDTSNQVLNDLVKVSNTINIEQ